MSPFNKQGWWIKRCSRIDGQVVNYKPLPGDVLAGPFSTYNLARDWQDRRETVRARWQAAWQIMLAVVLGLLIMGVWPE